jgi:hypothetical protein
MSYKVSGSWTGDIEEQHPTLELAHQRAQALLMEHPNANITIDGENFSGTVKAPATAGVQS